MVHIYNVRMNSDELTSREENLLISLFSIPSLPVLLQLFIIFLWTIEITPLPASLLLIAHTATKVSFDIYKSNHFHGHNSLVLIVQLSVFPSDVKQQPFIGSQL